MSMRSNEAGSSEDPASWLTADSDRKTIGSTKTLLKMIMSFNTKIDFSVFG
jgi:hypothetical protein